MRKTVLWGTALAVLVSCTGNILDPMGMNPGGEVPPGTNPNDPPPPSNLPPAKPGEAGVNALLFVTHVPQSSSFGTISTAFGNHLGDIRSVQRGGDLWIRYPDGTLRNLTQEAGFGSDGMQGANAISVRQPSPHWSGTKAVFSMVVGAPAKQYDYSKFYWQLYEVTGLAQGGKAVITKVANQPTNYNNVSPIYGTDDRIIYTSDRPRDGQAHLYPQLDEYESYQTNTGLWSLDPASGDLKLLDHAPSGAFGPSIDSFGRLIFSRWDHLTRDQQNDEGNHKCYNYDGEGASSKKTTSKAEVFPEPRVARTDLLAGTNLKGHSMNLFMPWGANEDGTNAETLNHIGRHELQDNFMAAIKDDPNVIDFSPYGSQKRTNPRVLRSAHMLREDPKSPGRFYMIDAPEFGTAASGMIAAISLPDHAPADGAVVDYISDPNTGDYTPKVAMGHYRSPTPMTDGTLVASYTSSSGSEALSTIDGVYRSNYSFRLVSLKKEGDYMVPSTRLTNGISKTIEYWNPDNKQKFSGELWEIDPVEIYQREIPKRRTTPLETPEANVFASANVSQAEFSAWLASKNLALVVSRNVTARDYADKQQPFNLKVANGTAETTTSGKLYTVSHLQFVQGDLIRGMEEKDGRRVLAQFLHDENAVSYNGANTQTGAVTIQSDGSTAAFVPARRALSWQLNGTDGTPLVRERYWVTFQPGEVRSCPVCHGLNSKDQKQRPLPTNEPEALRKVLEQWKKIK